MCTHGLRLVSILKSLLPKNLAKNCKAMSNKNSWVINWQGQWTTRFCIRSNLSHNTPISKSLSVALFSVLWKTRSEKVFLKSLLVFPKESGEEGLLGYLLTCLLYVLENSSPVWKLTFFTCLKGQKDGIMFIIYHSFTFIISHNYL